MFCSSVVAFMVLIDTLLGGNTYCLLNFCSYSLVLPYFTCSVLFKVSINQ
jgi:hypothetical protein